MRTRSIRSPADRERRTGASSPGLDGVGDRAAAGQQRVSQLADALGRRVADREVADQAAHHRREGEAARVEATHVVGEGDFSISRHAAQHSAITEITQIAVISGSRGGELGQAAASESIGLRQPVVHHRPREVTPADRALEREARLHPGPARVRRLHHDCRSREAGHDGVALWERPGPRLLAWLELRDHRVVARDLRLELSVRLREVVAQAPLWLSTSNSRSVAPASRPSRSRSALCSSSMAPASRFHGRSRSLRAMSQSVALPARRPLETAGFEARCPSISSAPPIAERRVSGGHAGGTRLAQHSGASKWWG